MFDEIGPVDETKRCGMAYQPAETKTQIISRLESIIALHQNAIDELNSKIKRVKSGKFKRHKFKTSVEFGRFF